MSEDAGEALRTEMRDIATNPSNPLHAGYQKADPAVMAQIDAKYSKVYGTAPVALDGGITTGPKDEPERDPLAVVAPEDKGAHEAMTKELTSTWGKDFDTQREHAARGLQEIEGAFGQEGAQELLDHYIAEGGTYAEAAKFLARRGASRKGGTR